MANCADNLYVIKYTDKTKGTISITKSSLVTNLVDIALVGKSRREYGEIFNENILHLLENFRCPANPLNIDSPDLTSSYGTLLSKPVQGQKWFNSTNQRLYVYSQGVWIPQGQAGDVVGNSGVIAHGEFLPRPVAEDGYVFPYSECSFVVSHHSTASNEGGTYTPAVAEIDYMACYVATTGQVTMRFRYKGESTLRNGYANYAIIGIRGETNPPLIDVTPYPVPSVTPSSTAAPTPTPTPTGTATPTPSGAAASQTPTPTATPTPTPTVGTSLSATPSPTPTPTPTPTPETQSGNLIAFGAVDQHFYSNEGIAGTGLVFNGFTNVFTTANQASTRYHWRNETNALDFAVAPYVDMGATIGNEPASWQNEYWIYITGGMSTNAYAQQMAGSIALDTWVNIGTGNPGWGMELQTATAGGAGEPTQQSYGISVYMQRSATQPTGLTGATLMGTLNVIVSAGPAP